MRVNPSLCGSPSRVEPVSSPCLSAVPLCGWPTSLHCCQISMLFLLSFHAAFTSRMLSLANATWTRRMSTPGISDCLQHLCKRRCLSLRETCRFPQYSQGSALLHVTHHGFASTLGTQPTLSTLFAFSRSDLNVWPGY